MPRIRVRFKANGPVLHRIVIDNEQVTVPAGDAGVTFELEPGRHFIAWFVRGAYPEIKYSLLANKDTTVLAYRANVPLGGDRKSYDSAEFTLADDPVAAFDAGGDTELFTLHNPVAENPDDYATPPEEGDVSFIPSDALPQ